MEYEYSIIRVREKDVIFGEKVLGFKIFENLMEIIKFYFLRRIKEEVQTKKVDNLEVRFGEKNLVGEVICDMFFFVRKNDLIVWIRFLFL